MSFALTTDAFKARSKTVTRRVGWRFLQPGDMVCAVVKGMGLKPGEKIERLGTIRVISVRAERIDAIDAADVVREGFPGMTPREFVEMFCKHMRVDASWPVNRIEFEHVAGEEE